MADDVEGHFRPPAVALAVAGRPVGRAGAVRGLVGERLEFGEGLGRGIEAQGAFRRRHPDLALAVEVDGGGAAGPGDAVGRLEDLNCLVGIEPAQAALARIDVEPDDPVPIVGQPRVLAAMPFWPFTLNILTAPVCASMRPIEVV